MAGNLSFSLAPNPKWYIADLTGKPLGGGYLATFSNLNHSILNPVFTDASGATTWPYVTIPNVGKLGILFDDNGSQGPFYFQLNAAVPQQLYYLEVYDSSGVLQWTINNFTPNSGGGSGPIITTALNLNNLVTNSIMLRNYVGNTPVATSQFMRIAPGAHSGLSKTPANAGPDIVFLKNNSTATDTLTFVNFAQGETFPNGEPTPLNYLRYSCTIAGSAETQKCVQYPITHGVQNIQNQAVTVTIFARCTAGNTSLTLNWLQFFGDGPSASLSTPVAIQTVTLTANWQKIVIVPPGANVPSTTGKTIGECGNDGLFLQVQYPFSATTTMDITKPSIYMGSIVPETDFSVNDAIEAVMYNPRTGSVIQTYDTTFLGGYVAMNDGTIGDGSSGATNLADISTFPLYNLLYTNVTIPSGNTLCVVTGYTGNAINDFVNHKPMQLPVALGRAFATYGTGSGLTPRVLAQIVGEEAHTMTTSELAVHDHPGSVAPGSNSGPSPVTPYHSFSGSPNSVAPGGQTAITVAAQGANTPFNIMQPTSFIATFLKL